MATKWKSTIPYKLLNRVITNSKFRLLVGLLSGVLTFILLYAMLKWQYVLNTREVWRYGITANIFMILSAFLLLRFYLNKTYRKSQSAGEYSYRDWKHLVAQQQKILLSAILFLGFLAVSYLVNLVTRNNSYGYYWGVSNYATGYVLVFSAFVLFLTCEFTLAFFMRRLLDDIMARTDEANKKIVDAAIESSLAAEKKSIQDSIRSEQLKIDLISNVSHDLKTPLTSMVGYIDLMKKEDLNDTMTDYVEVLSNKAQKLKEMIESLFSLAKTSSGNIELHPEPLNLNRLLEQIYADMEDKIVASPLEFVLSLTAEEAELTTDSGYLYRICQNLIENALKYSADNTRVFLKTASLQKDRERLLRFEITNTAAYRMDFTKEQIVERFARGDASRTGEGNGLGLAIVSTYTSALGGRFDLSIDCDQFRATLEFTVSDRAEDG